MDDPKKRKKDEEVQEADEESFPASDPPAWTMGSDDKPAEKEPPAEGKAQTRWDPPSQSPPA